MKARTYKATSEWLDARAPLVLVERIVAVREVLAPPPPGDDLSHDLYTRCPEASHALALGLRRLGVQAEILSCSRLGDPHLAVRSGQWLLDATAEQFGVEGPVVRWLGDFPHQHYELSPDDEPIEPAELELICELAPDYDPDEPNKAAALLRATGLEDLEAGLRDLAWDQPGKPRPCFCGAAPAGWWRMDIAYAWGCETHLSRCGLRGDGRGLR